MFAKILIPAAVAALGLIAVPAADAHTRHHHHAAPTSLFASPHTHTHRSLKTHAHHRSLKSRHIHASVSHTSKITHTSKPLSETVAGQPDA